MGRFPLLLLWAAPPAHSPSRLAEWLDRLPYQRKAHRLCQNEGPKLRWRTISLIQGCIKTRRRASSLFIPTQRIVSPKLRHLVLLDRRLNHIVASLLSRMVPQPPPLPHNPAASWDLAKCRQPSATPAKPPACAPPWLRIPAKIAMGAPQPVRLLPVLQSLLALCLQTTARHQEALVGSREQAPPLACLAATARGVSMIQRQPAASPAWHPPWEVPADS